MKLLIDAHCFDYPTSEGVNTYIRGIYKSMPRIASDFEFFFMAQNLDKIKSIFGENNNVHYVQLKQKNRFGRLLIEIPKIVKEYEIDVAHFQYTSPIVKNCKTIVTLHDILFKDFPQLFPLNYRIIKDILFNYSAKKADLLLTVSDYSRRRISYHYGIPEGKIYVTPNAVSDDFFRINKDEAIEFIKRKGVEKYILYVSRIEPRKNHFALLKSFDELELAEKGIHLVFIGRYTLTSYEFDEYLSNLKPNTRSHIHIFNNVSYHDLKLWYKGSLLFIFPALAEGFGIPPIEAGAAGIPCICNNSTAMGEFSFFGSNLVDLSVGAILNNKIVENLLAPPSSEELMFISKTIQERYNWDTIADNLYHQIKRL